MKCSRMKGVNLLIMSACLAVGVGLSSILNSYNGESRKESEVRLVLDRYHAALKTRDDRELDNILSDKLRLVTKFEDTVLSRKELLERFHSVKGDLESVESRDIKVKIDGSDVSLKCNEKMVLNSKEMGPIVHEAYYTYGFRNDSGEWRIVSVQQQ